jgi:hypothetical protein
MTLSHGIIQRHGRSLCIVAALVACAGAGLAQDKAQAPAAPVQDVKDDRALMLLKGMSDKLAGAKTLSFTFRGLVPIAAPTGQFVSMFASTRVVMQRPDKLLVQARGDLFPSDLYYDGKTVTAIGLDKKFYAQRVAAGGAVEALLREPLPGTDTVAPFFDLLVPDPYAGLTKDLSSALWVGQSTIAGVKTEHLAFTSPGVEWEIWIGSADKLPRVMVVSYRSGERQPTFTAEFSDWKLDTALPARTFNAPIPKGAVKIEFKAVGPTSAK